MIERLRFQWHQGMSFDAIIDLRDELDTKLQQIRSERHIRSQFLSVRGVGILAKARSPTSVFAP